MIVSGYGTRGNRGPILVAPWPVECLRRGRPMLDEPSRWINRIASRSPAVRFPNPGSRYRIWPASSFLACLASWREAAIGTGSTQETSRQSPCARPRPAVILPGLPKSGGCAVVPRVLLVACVLVLFAGCGQKGPLYLPEDAPREESTGEAED